MKADNTLLNAALRYWSLTVKKPVVRTSQRHAPHASTTRACCFSLRAAPSVRAP